MFVLQIEHTVPSYESWKEAFDDDPLGRKSAGVRAYRIYRPATDSKYLIVDLEFDSILPAESMLAKLHELWGKVEGRIMVEPRARIVQVVEEKTL